MRPWGMRGGWGHDDESGPRGGPWLWTAYRAYNELLKEKVKARFEKQEGPWMDQVADVLVEWVNLRWEGGKVQEEKEKAVREKLDKLLSQ